MEHLNVQQFRDRTASYYRVMNVDRASCIGDLEKNAFIPRVKTYFDEAMQVKCARATAYDRKRYDRILSRMETFLIENSEGFEQIGLCA